MQAKKPYVSDKYTTYGRLIQTAAFCILLFLLCFQALAKEPQRPAPEIATGRAVSHPATGTYYMAVTAHPEATKAAEAILQKGGSAADAAIAAQMVLGLVEPQSSGIGGGTFLLYYDAKKGELVSLDGREEAPSTASGYLFRGEDGKPMAFMEAVVGGRAVGVPGTVRALETLHGWYGVLPWEGLFVPAITMAERGFPVTPRLSQSIKADSEYLRHYVPTKLYFYPDLKTEWQAGDMVRNPEYAITLRTVATGGADAFYSGEIAGEIIKAVRETASDNPGLMSLEDLETYEAKERVPVCGSYRKYKICAMGEPSSGGLTLLSILGMLEHFDLKSMGAKNPESWHVIAEASRLAFADRDYYMADPDAVRTPGAALIDREYLKARAARITATPAKNVVRGIPPGWSDEKPAAPEIYIPRRGTTHMCIVDRYGNIISMTSSIEGAFGSKLMAGGFLLNSQLTDFSFNPAAPDGTPIANAAGGGKRPRSSMTPVIVFDPDNRPFLVIGSAGGSRIIGYVAQRIIAVIDWGMDVQDALNAPNIVNTGKGITLESGTKAEDLLPALQALGHPVHVEDMASGLTAIRFKNGKMTGAADPRREGTAAGF